jgi:hypothetical protein
VKFHWTLLAVGLILPAGCNRGLENKEAVRQAVIDHLATRSNLNVGSMQVDVTSVSFRGDEVDATVSFRAKGADSGSGMTMDYTLERKSSRWVVKSRRETGATPHGSMEGAMPEGMPSGELPAGHPPVTGQSAPVETAPRPPVGAPGTEK